MNKKIKLAFAAFLGFSSACSSVKNTSASAGGMVTDGPDTINIERPIRVMYGVPMPEPIAVDMDGAPLVAPDSLAVDSTELRRIVVMYGVRFPGTDGAKEPIDATLEEAPAEKPSGK